MYVVQSKHGILLFCVCKILRHRVLFTCLEIDKSENVIICAAFLIQQQSESNLAKYRKYMPLDHYVNFSHQRFETSYIH